MAASHQNIIASGTVTVNHVTGEREEKAGEEGCQGG